jgi:hypothetical protein
LFIISTTKVESNAIEKNECVKVLISSEEMCSLNQSNDSKKEKKKGQATHITPLNLVPLLASAPGGLKGAGCMRLTPPQK